MTGTAEDRRKQLPRRCAWCERFCIEGEWRQGRREVDSVLAHQAHGASMTHTICDDCVERLRTQGKSR